MPDELRADTERAAAENVKRVHRAPDVDPFDDAAQSPYEITALHGEQDRLAPDGRLSPRQAGCDGA